MYYKTIPYVSSEVSEIFFGTATKDMQAGKNVNDLLDAIFDMGVNAFDLARNYGSAEKSFGYWLEARKNRDKVVILSKGGHPSVFGKKRINEKEIRKDFEESCRELHTDYIDIYLLHRDDPSVEVGEIVEVLNTMHAEGKIGAFGGSNWTHQRIAEANTYASEHGLIPFSVSSPNFGLAEQVNDPWGGGCVTISGPQNEDARAWYREQNMPVIAYSSLGRGFFSGKLKSSDEGHERGILDSAARKGYCCSQNYERLRRCEELAAQKGVTVSQIALAWIFAQDINTFAVVSTTKPERMRQNIAALSLALTPEEAAYLDLKRNSL